MQLEKTWLEEIAVEAIGIDDVQRDQPQSYQLHELDFDILKNAEHPAFRVKLTVEIRGANDGAYSAFRRVRIVLWGEFLFPLDATQEVIDSLIPLNPLSILYGVARGIVAASTGTSPAGNFTLPVVDFIQVLEAKQQAERALVEPPKKRKRRSIPAKAEPQAEKKVNGTGTE